MYQVDGFEISFAKGAKCTCDDNHITLLSIKFTNARRFLVGHQVVRCIKCITEDQWVMYKEHFPQMEGFDDLSCEEVEELKTYQGEANEKKRPAEEHKRVAHRLQTLDIPVPDPETWR
eukprot:CAMPEP_0170147434 /NCGR_PEP_ID=MMETSP0033_2-20121228/34388_1 /TAXON_ID=195969 /ORGANISM="Dolichomastix tenuilepis, Strain CCMP3274" /LENGTH=117 /DNA_ID=CAMNT_0010384241 /DNA_START=79 /DNA_END=428 /DNA_ORIENTATION=-